MHELKLRFLSSKGGARVAENRAKAAENHTRAVETGKEHQMAKLIELCDSTLALNLDATSKRALNISDVSTEYGLVQVAFQNTLTLQEESFNYGLHDILGSIENKLPIPDPLGKKGGQDPSEKLWRGTLV